MHNLLKVFYGLDRQEVLEYVHSALILGLEVSVSSERATVPSSPEYVYNVSIYKKIELKGETDNV